VPWKITKEKQMETPCLLDKVLDDVGCGAIFKNVETDRKAIVVDFDGGGSPLICTYHGDEDENKAPSFKASDYKISKLSDSKQWIVLTKGQDDFILVD
jgi:hypothetical protein